MGPFLLHDGVGRRESPATLYAAHLHYNRLEILGKSLCKPKGAFSADLNLRSDTMQLTFQQQLYNGLLYSLASAMARYDPESAAVLSLEIGRRLRTYLERCGYPIPHGDTFRESCQNIVNLFTEHGEFEMLSAQMDADGVSHVRTHQPGGVLPTKLVVEEGADPSRMYPVSLLIYNELERFGLVGELQRIKIDEASGEVETSTRFRPRSGPAPAEGPLRLNVEHVVGVERDRARTLEAINAEMARLHQLKAEIIAGVSHELKTPLHCILGYTDLLRDNVAPARKEEYLDVIEFNGKQLLRLVDDVLDWSRLEVGYLQLQYNEVPLQTLLDRTARSLVPLAVDKSIELGVAVEPEELVVQADPIRLLQVTTNLAVNAIKFSPHGGRVVMSARQQAHYDDLPDDFRPARPWMLRIDVRDQGVGIAPEDQERIFESFQQVHPAEGRSPGGTGLGLAIARRIVELHGGRLWVTSRPNEGSVFSVVIPPAPGLN